MEVKSRQKFSKFIQIMSYLLIWTALIVAFWIRQDAEAMGYTLLTFYLILPVSTFLISFFIGKDSSSGNYKWLMLLFFGIMYMLAEYATFSLANTVSFGKRHMPELANMLPGILCSAAGMGLGAVLSGIKRRKK